MRKDRLVIIAIIEDDALASMIKDVLNDIGHDVRVFSNPMLCSVYREGQNGCPQEAPCADVLIVDQDLTRMSGLEFFLLQREKGCLAHDHFKGILISSENYSSQREKISQLGFTVFKKPFKAKDVIEWINKCSISILQ